MDLGLDSGAYTVVGLVLAARGLGGHEPQSLALYSIMGLVLSASEASWT